MPTLIYKKQLISGAPAVTDNVEAGNMKPVTSNAVARLSEINKIRATNLNAAFPSDNKTAYYYSYQTDSNVPIEGYNWQIETKRIGSQLYQIAIGTNANNKHVEYQRSAVITNNVVTWSSWEKLITESELNDKITTAGNIIKFPNGTIIQSGVKTANGDAYIEFDENFLNANYSITIESPTSSSIRIGNKFTSGFGIVNGANLVINFIAVGRWK